MSVRIDKLLSVGLGVSRTEAKRLLADGCVTADGKTLRSGADKVDPALQRVCVNGARVQYSEHVYLVMNKPLGVVSSTEEKGAVTVLDIVPDALRRKGLFPAGRLDKYSEGMLILTDDGEFAHRILAPRHHLPKIYEVTLDAPIIDDRLVAEFAKGVYLGGGERSSPAVLVPHAPDRARVTIYEGIYHQVRRMFDQNGAHVTRLRRIQIGGLPLDPALAPGDVRKLTDDELALMLSGSEGEDTP